jgi:acyl-CoA hydrolase
MRRPNDTSVTKILPVSVDAGLWHFNFGQLLELLDALAEQTALDYTARSHPRVTFVTAAIDSIRLRGTPDVSQDMVLLARVNYVGKTSLEIGIRVEQPGEPPLHYASCYFTMVARAPADSNQAIQLPPLAYEDDMERRRERRAIQRRTKYTEDAGPESQPPTREEEALLAELHMAQEGNGFNGRLVCDLTRRGYDRPYPEAGGRTQRVVGGYVIHRAYAHAALCAELVAPNRPIVVSVNRVNFHQPVRPDDRLHFTSRVTYTGDTSICVEVDIVRESRDRTTAALCNTCTFTFRNIDDRLTPRPVPKVYPTTYAEDIRYLAAHRRRQHRLARA